MTVNSVAQVVPSTASDGQRRDVDAPQPKAAVQVRVEMAYARGGKCCRCWKILPEVEVNPFFLCCRRGDAVDAWLIAQGLHDAASRNAWKHRATDKALAEMRQAGKFDPSKHQTLR